MAAISRFEDLERSLAYSVVNQYDASFRLVINIVTEGSNLSDREKLFRLRAFIEEHAFSSKQQVDLKDSRIQQLFDQAVIRALHQDCIRALKIHQEHLEERRSREHFLALSHQEEARKAATEQGVLGRLRRSVESLWDRIYQNSSVEPLKVYQVQAEEDLILLESVETREERTLMLLERWEADPFLLPIDSELQKGIDELRNNLLPKGKELNIPREENRPTLQFRRIS